MSHAKLHTSHARIWVDTCRNLDPYCPKLPCDQGGPTAHEDLNMAQLPSTCPTWALSMVRNYRDAFKAEYGREPNLTNEQIFEITNTIFDDESKTIEDAARVEAMHDLDQKAD